MKDWKRNLSGLLIIAIIISLTFVNDDVQPLIIFPFFLLTIVLMWLDLVKEYKCKEEWSAEKQLKTWVTGKTSYRVFKTIFVVLFSLLCLASLIVYLTTGEFTMSWSATY